jgi:hypothetical protein
MGINTANGQKQQLSTISSKVIKPTNTTQNQPCSNQRKRRQKKKLGQHSPAIALKQKKSPTYSNMQT